MEEIFVELKLTYNIHVLNQTKKCYHISTTDTRFLNRLYLRKQCLWFSMLMINKNGFTFGNHKKGRRGLKKISMLRYRIERATFSFSWSSNRGTKGRQPIPREDRRTS